MENTLHIKNIINDQEVSFDLIVNARNDYVVKTEEVDDTIIVRDLSRKRNIITFFKYYKIAGMLVKELEITDEELKVIDEIEEKFKQQAIERDAKRKEDLMNGTTTIKVNKRSGKLLNGYVIFGHEAELLKELGVAKTAGGWQTLVDEEFIEAVGEEFTYEQAAAYAKPLVEKREKEQAEKDAKIAEAKKTGEKVTIRQWQEKCNNARKNCELDNMSEVALPDGKTKIERRHTAE
ncbi:hypothetical protein SAMN05216238_101240 [Lentibacillus persicus]|uniref:Uncharacterized protein n=1 Tax=Lentibacillus persicus TaxID=640948 RepID=A0A1I1S550_9BACI|nr:hypothetical protein [Lentibacillus persicus]SFD41626.1 hypothetical protein SAMN05216238_101240 [Lentibacillus persicus]